MNDNLTPPRLPKIQKFSHYRRLFTPHLLFDSPEYPAMAFCDIHISNYCSKGSPQHTTTDSIEPSNPQDFTKAVLMTLF